MWRRIKRLLVGLAGFAIMGWSVFATDRLLETSRFTGSWDSWVLGICLIVMFCLGCFATYIAWRGSDKDVDDILP